MQHNFSENDGVNRLLGKVLADVQSFTESQIQHIGRLNKIGVALSAESNREKLFEMIINQAMEFTSSDGGTLYIMSDDKKELKFTVVANRSLDTYMGGTKSEITWPELPLYKKDGSQNKEMVAVLCALEGQQINIQDVYTAEGFNFEGTKKFDSTTGYRSKSMLVVPMKNYDGDVVGVLQLINRMTEKGEIGHYDCEDEQSTLSLASQAAMALTNLKLIGELEALLESFIRSIASAIDAKSPYTGGHVRKVAEISVMIAKALHEAESGSYKDVLYDEEQLNEIRIAALMHDIGKITTPEYVVDKATKLETIYDRIESIRYRFEIIKRDMEIEMLKQEIIFTKSGKAYDFALMREELQTKINDLESDFYFLQSVNLGSEFMADGHIERLTKIAQKQWRCCGETRFLVTEDEVYNLSIRKGTLNDEERLKINDHVTMSLKMLSALPFPKKLKRVPEIAGGHHEKLNGKGYPLGLTAEELSLEARVLALADIFEALTAADRPYKPAKKLSEVLKIINFMVKDQELDGDLVRFFLENNLHLKYAKIELREDQIDI